MAAGGCSVADLMRLFISFMILATLFVIPAQAATKTQAQNFNSTSGQLRKVQRSSFPKHFVFGTSSSAYQVGLSFPFCVNIDTHNSNSLIYYLDVLTDVHSTCSCEMVMSNARIYPLLQRLFIYHYPNVTDRHLVGGWVLDPGCLEILGENAICWSVVEYFSGSFAAGL